MKTFRNLKVGPHGGDAHTPNYLRTGLWGQMEGSDTWYRVCECPIPITFCYIDPIHLKGFTQGHISPAFDSMEIAETVRNIYEVCRRNGGWTTGRGQDCHSFHLSDLQKKQGLSVLLDTGFVLKNDDETYTVTRGLVMLLVANELDPTSLAKKTVVKESNAA